MRLINTKTQDLEEYVEHSHIPRNCYYILSHRWGEDETTYKDYQKLRKRDSTGYRKINDFCRFVQRRHGYAHVWVDTCCIDKRSSAELSEAINSMWDWYTIADICYVHLANVSDAAKDEGKFEDETLADLFRLSDWITRGWTLQELLAPQTVVFVNRSWQVLGHKGREDRLTGLGGASLGPNLNAVISEITGIGRKYLSHRPNMYDASLACRISCWAAKRRTTRIEDTAYCLIGLLEVNMPLLYGEGQRAFRRLQEEVIRTSDDDSIFAWGYLQKDLKKSSVLASSPKDFESCGNITKTRNVDNYSSMPYTMINNSLSYVLTNKGLQIHSPIKRLHEHLQGTWHIGVPLSCAAGDDALVPLMLYLRQEGDRWVREDVGEGSLVANTAEPQEVHEMLDMLIDIPKTKSILTTWERFENSR